jgi:DNA replication protein DnaC
MKAPSVHCEARLPLLLKQLRLPTVAANFSRLAKEAASGGQPYEEYLLSLLEQEVTQRDINRRKRRIRDAHFPRLYTLDEYDFSLMPDLPQEKILQLARCDFMDQAENVVFVGAIGTGKTHLAISLGLAACQQGRQVRFFTAAGLVNTLLEAAEQHRLSRLEKLLMKQDLVIIDEVGFVPFSQQGANMLFTFVSQRYLQGSLLVTTNLAFADWGEVFGNAISVGPLLDRLTHRCHIVQFSGDSYRFRQSLERQQELAQAGRGAIVELTKDIPGLAKENG